MNKNRLLGIIMVLLLVVGTFFVYKLCSVNRDNEDDVSNFFEGLVVSVDSSNIVLMSNDDIFYTIDRDMVDGNLGDNVIVEYVGILDDDFSSVEIVDYSLLNFVDVSDMPSVFDDNGIFSDYYVMAYNKLKELSLDEKIGQMILARYDKDRVINDIDKYSLGGLVFFESDFKNKNKSQVKKMINDVQNKAKIPLITAVDEEGGKIVRISSNPMLSEERFKSSRELYKLGGMDLIYDDTVNKSMLLSELGINVNLAPVVDVSMDSNDYMYERSLGKNTETTSLYARTVIDASKGLGVSYTLKHFPGYGNNIDTHTNVAIDNRSYESILENDIPPFEAGIDEGAEAVLISHNVVSSIDGDNPASLSKRVHNLLRDDLGFSGVIITDDLSMGAISSVGDVSIKAVLAGNNMLITTNYIDSFNSIKDAVKSDIISEEMIDRLVFKVLSWKYYKGLMIEVK